MSPKRTQALALVVLATLAVWFAASVTESASGGVARQGTQTQLDPAGCVCHGPEGKNGVPNANVTAFIRFTPNDVVFKPGQTYNVSVGPERTDVPPNEGGNQGGFNLRVNVGELGPGAGFEEWVQVLGVKNEATHTKAGDEATRVYNLTWKAPGTDVDPAVFTLFVNTVNGDDANTELDHWTGLTVVLLNKPGAAIGAGTGFENPEHIGVNWLAHWVGIVSFVAVIVTLMIYYFVLKYGESVHTTDHRDRKEK